MAIKRGFGDRLLIVFREKPVDGIVATARLFFLSSTALSIISRENFLDVPRSIRAFRARDGNPSLRYWLSFLLRVEIPGLFRFPLGEYDILKADIFQKLVGLLPFYLTENDRMKQLTPK